MVSGPTWHDRIEARRAELFVGRDDELSVFSRFLDDPWRRLLHVHGRGGIGKTTLLAAFARTATARGLRVRRLDGRTLPLTPSLLSEELVRADVDLLVIDEFQVLAPLESWIRDEVFPSLHDRLRVVTARREPLGTEWRMDPGIHALSMELELHPFTPRESEELLERCCIAPRRRAEIVAFAQGLPLALSLAASARATDTAGLGSELAETLAGRLLRDVRSSVERRTVEVAALNRVTTRALLEAVLGDFGDADACYEWLNERPYCTRSPEGLRLHDVLREAVVQKLSSEDELRRRELVDRSIEHHLAQQFGRFPHEYRSAMRSVIALTEVEASLALGTLGIPPLLPDALRETDRLPILDHIEATRGKAERRIAERAMDKEPAGALVGRARDGSAKAYLHFIELETALHLGDPVSDLFVQWVRSRPPLGRGERALLCRHQISLGGIHAYEGFAYTELVLRLFATPGIMLAASAQPMLEYERHPEYDLHHQLGFASSGDLDFLLFGHDLREGSFNDAARLSALERVRFLRGGVDGPDDGSSRRAPDRPARLARERFEAEIRRALKAFHHRERLARSPLLGTALLNGSRDVDTLRKVLESACRELGDQGMDAVHRHVLLATYIDDGRKQLAIAQDLGMGYSTLRKRLAEATRRLTDTLWERDRRGR